MGGEVGHVEIMDHAGNGHRANIGVLLDDVVRRCVRERQDSDVRGVDSAQRELVDTSKDHRALTSASACLGDRQRFGRAHSGLLLRRELALNRRGCHRLRRTLQFVAVRSKLVQGLVHQ